MHSYDIVIRLWRAYLGLLTVSIRTKTIICAMNLELVSIKVDVSHITLQLFLENAKTLIHQIVQVTALPGGLARMAMRVLRPVGIIRLGPIEAR